MRKTSRRPLAAAAALGAFALLLAGCGSAAPADDSGDSGGGNAAGGFADATAVYDELASNPPLEIEPLPEAAEEGVTVGFVNCTIPACLPGGGAEPGEALGWTVTDFPYDLAKGPADIAAAVERAIASAPDVLMLNIGVAKELVQDQVDAAIESGIKIIDIGGDTNPEGYSGCIQCQPAVEAQGAALANVALADAGETTAVGVITDKTIPALVYMADAAAATIEENGDGSTAEMIVLNVADNPASNASNTVSYLQRNPDIEYLLYTTPALLAGTSSALAAAGLDVKIISVNPSNDGDVALLESGDVDLWVAGESGESAYVWRAFDAAVRAVQDVPLDPIEPITSMRLITPEDPDPTLQAPTDFKEIYKEAWGVS